MVSEELRRSCSSTSFPRHPREGGAVEGSSPSSPSSAKNALAPRTTWSANSSASLASTILSGARLASKDRKAQQQGNSKLADQLAVTWNEGTRMPLRPRRSSSSGALVKMSLASMRLLPLSKTLPKPPTLQCQQQAVSTQSRGFALLDWKAQYNPRVPSNSGMLARLAKLRQKAIKMATQIQESKFQLQMMRQSNERAKTEGLNALPALEDRAEDDVQEVEDKKALENEKKETFEDRAEQDVKNVTSISFEPKRPAAISFDITCTMEDTSMAKGKKIVLSAADLKSFTKARPVLAK